MNWPAIALVLIALSGAGGFWFGSDYKEKSIKAEVQAERDAYEKGMLLVAGELSKVKVVQKNSTQILEKEVRTQIQYQECKHTPEALKVINEALTGSKKQ